MLAWSKERDDLERLTIGSMAKYTLASNAAKDRDLLSILKRESGHQPKEVTPILTADLTDRLCRSWGYRRRTSGRSRRSG